MSSTIWMLLDGRARASPPPFARSVSAWRMSVIAAASWSSLTLETSRGRSSDRAFRRTRRAPCEDRRSDRRPGSRASCGLSRRSYPSPGAGVDFLHRRALQAHAPSEGNRRMRRVKSRERAVFKALSNDVRRRLLELVAQRERSVSELADEVKTSPSLTSIHLGGLRRAGLVEARVRAKQRIYRLRGDGLTAARGFLAFLESSAPVVAPERSPVLV